MAGPVCGPGLASRPRESSCDDVDSCRAACEAGDPSGCVAHGEIATMLLRDPAQGEASLRTACNAGIEGACASLATTLYLLERPAEAAEAVRPGCTAGNATSCGALGTFLVGAGRADEALVAYGQACACAEFPLSCVGLGATLAELGVPAANDRTVAFLQADCDRGEAESCMRLGLVLTVAGETEAAVAPLDAACRADHTSGCRYLGAVLVELERLDDAEGVVVRLAGLCRQGDDDACESAADLEQMLRPAPVEPGPHGPARGHLVGTESGDAYGEWGRGTFSPQSVSPDETSGESGGSSPGQQGTAAADDAPPRVTFVVETIAGGLDERDVTRLLRQNEGRVRHCYDVALASAPGLAATIPLRLVVSADGSAAVQATTEAGGAELSDCVAAVLRRIAYPPADDGTACTLSVVLDHGQHGW